MIEVKIIEITEEMVSNKELAGALNANFKALKEALEGREKMIIDRLTTMQNEITAFKKEIKGDINKANGKLDILIDRLIPDKKLLTDNKKVNKKDKK